ncbi:MAG: hypothetical protein R2911_43095 [Caldilineaceae bacterium]
MPLRRAPGAVERGHLFGFGVPVEGETVAAHAGHRFGDVEHSGGAMVALAALPPAFRMSSAAWEVRCWLVATMPWVAYTSGLASEKWCGALGFLIFLCWE